MRIILATILLVLATMITPMAGDNPTIAELHWLTGSWHGEGLGGQIEEHWTSESAGTMLGAFRLAADGNLRVIEYIMIAEDDDRVVYRFKHFRTDYTTWEEDRPLEFTLIECTATKAVFHSDIPDQHSPRRITYELTSKDSLAISVEGSDDDGNLTDGFTLRFARGKL